MGSHSSDSPRYWDGWYSILGILLWAIVIGGIVGAAIYGG